MGEGEVAILSISDALFGDTNRAHAFMVIVMSLYSSLIW